MKKIIALLLAVSITMSLFCVPANAAESPKIIYNASASEVKPGDRITVDVEFKNFVDVSSYLIAAKFDSSKLRLEKEPETLCKHFGYQFDEEYCEFLGFFDGASALNQAYVRYTFVVSDTVNAGSSITLNFTTEMQFKGGGKLDSSIPQNPVVLTVASAQIHTHTWDKGTVSTEPTCTESGIMTYTCACGETQTEPIPAKGHTPGSTATCTTPQKCTVCGTEIKPATGHKWDSGAVTKLPTCTDSGIKTYTCSKCGETKTETVPAKGHIPGSEPTCTASQKCTVCSAQIKPALGHNYQGSYYYTAHPHEEYQKCTRCDTEKKTGKAKEVEGCTECIKTYTITYNANGGSTAPSPQTAQIGTAVTLPLAEPTMQGYSFTGWNSKADGSGTSYIPGKSYIVDTSVTLYAQWEKANIPAALIKLNQITANLLEGESITLIAVVEPYNATNKRVIWTSSDLSVAAVKDGVVTAVGKGNAVITAKTEDGGKTAECHVVVNLLFGDVNGDGKLDNNDLTLILDHIKGISQLSADKIECADYNNDRKLDIRDFNYLQNTMQNMLINP